MSTPKKPRIRPKADPQRARSEPATHDPPFDPEHDPAPFTEQDREVEPKDAGRVVFHEDDCLR